MRFEVEVEASSGVKCPAPKEAYDVYEDEKEKQKKKVLGMKRFRGRVGIERRRHWWYVCTEL